MKPKVPNPVTKDHNQASYFENTTDGGIRCIAAALTLDSDTHIVICAPDAVVLRKAWSKLTTAPLDIKKAPIVLYKYDSDLTRIGRDQLEEFKAEDFSIKKEKDSTVVTIKFKGVDEKMGWFWYYNPKQKECFIEERTYLDALPSDIRLGSAMKCSEEECLNLLRQNRIPRGDIQKINIITDLGCLIPF